MKQFNIYTEIREDVYIHLKDRKSRTIAFCIIDKQDLNKVNDRHWHLDHKGYCRSSCTYGKVYIHNLILGIKHSYSNGVDHIDRNPLNNKRVNLRIVSHKENIYNRRMPKSNTSGIEGVCFESSRNKWRAYYRGNFLGRFSTKIEAVDALRLGKEAK